MLGSGFKELFLVDATNNLPVWGTIVDHNASVKMFLPDCARPVSAEYAIHGLYGTIRSSPEIKLTQGSVTQTHWWRMHQ